MKINLSEKSKSMLIVFAIIFVSTGLLFLDFSDNETQNNKEKYQGTDLSQSIGGVNRDGIYSDYLTKVTATIPSKNIDVDITNLTKNSTGTEILAEYENENNVVMTQEVSFAEWEVTVPEDALYQIYVEYYPVPSKNTDILRSLYLNGEM